MSSNRISVAPIGWALYKKTNINGELKPWGEQQMAANDVNEEGKGNHVGCTEELKGDYEVHGHER